MSRLLLRDLEPGRLYRVAVRAVSQDGYSEFGQLVDVTTVSDSVAPAAPSGLSWTVEGTAFKAVWTKPTLDGDGTALEDFRDYQVTLFSSAAPATKAVYYTNADRFDFPFESNLAAFGTPRASVTIEVRSRDHTGNISAAPVTATAVNAAPSAPTALTGQAVYDGVSLKWTGVSDADLLEYRVYHGTTAVGATNLVFRGLATSFIHSLSTYATDAYYRVVAADVFNTESTAATAGPYKPLSPYTVDTIAPGVPTGLAATLTNATDGKTAKAAVTWTAVTDTDNDLAEYIVGYKPSTETNWQFVKVDYTNTATTLVGLLPYVDYDFRIRSADWAANLSAWSTTVTKTATANTAPATVTGVAITAGKDSVTVKWTENTEVDVANGAGLYMVDIATDAAFTAGLLSYRVGAPQITVSGLAQSQTYYARVKAVDSLGLSSVAWSTAVNATTGAFPLTPLSDGSAPASSPVPVVSAGIGYLYASVTPIANNDAVTYEWHVGTTSGFTANASSKVAEIAGTTIIIEKDGAGATLAYGTTYYVKTIAKDRDGSAAASAASAGVQLAKATSTDISATSRELGSVITTTAATAPSSPLTGDIWNDTTSGFQKQWSGSAWVVLPTASSAYIASRGTDLVTNGTGLLGTNYNFTSLTFDGSDAPAGAGGSFVSVLGNNGTINNDEFIPYDPNKVYRLSYAARQRGVGQSDARIYDGLAPYDGSKNLIAPINYMYTTGTSTTLAAPLNPGDTVVYLTSTANWYGSAAKPAGASTQLRTIIWWDYVDNFGKAWPAETYSRNTYGTDKWADGAVDTTANTITLRAAYSGPAKAAGTKLSNGGSGGTYIYGNSNLAVPETWTAITTPTVTGIANTGGQAQFTTGLPYGTAFIKVTFLPNRSLGSPYLNSSSQHAFASISFSDTNAATYIANTALTSANGKNKITYSQVVPGTTPNTIGDVWFQLGDGVSVSSGQIIAQWQGGGGTTWYSKTINNQVIANLDAGKITTGQMDAARIRTEQIVITTSQVTSLDTTLGAKADVSSVTPTINLVNSWKNPTDTTKIDGGYIYTHSVDANVLKTSTLSAAVVTIGAGGIIQTNTGGVQITDSGIIIPAGALDANIIKANTSFITTINVGAGGKIQSTGYTDAGTSGFKLDNTGLTIKGAGNTIDASVLKGGTITGTTINVGAGGTLNIDSTAVVKSNNWASLSTGYKLDSAGLEVNDGAINAKTLVSGTISTATLTLSGANGKIIGTGFSLSGTGLSVTSGTISAAALQIQQGNNLVPAEYAGFEYIPSFYTGKTVNDAGLTATVVSTQKRFGSQALELVNVNAATAVSYFTTNTATDRNIEVEASTVVIGSMWVYQSSGVAKTFSIRFMWDNAATVDTGSTSVPSGTWTRIYGVATVPAGVSKAIVGVVMPASTTADIDGVQVERQLGSLSTPSAWKMPGLTSIDGGIIRTGQMQSTATINVNGVPQPAWSINMSGNAQFGNATVRGKLLVGVDGDPDAGASSISSGNYMPGTGWKIDSAGNVEFNSGTFRGTVSASTFSGNNVITGSVISGPVTGTHAEMTADGFRVYAEDLLDGVPNEVIRMGVANTNDTFAITDSNGKSDSSIDETGRGNFNSISIRKDVPEWGTDTDGNPKLVSGLEIYGKEFSQYIEGLSRGVVASGYLGTDWTPPLLNTQGEVGLGEVSFVQDGSTGKARSYKVTFNGMHGVASTARCTVIFRLRYTVDGTSPSVAAGAGSSVADSVLLQVDTISEAVTVPPMMVQSAWTTTPGAVVRVLLTAQRYYGTGSWQIKNYIGSSIQKPIRLFVEDCGLDVPDTWQTNYGGNDFSGGAPAAPVVKKTYTTTWSSTDSGTYRGDGVKRTDTADVVQGYSSYATINGNGKGLWIFPTMTTTLSGATVNKVEVYAYANHWYYNAGGTAMIKVHGYTTTPASSPALTDAISSANWPKPGGRWITLPASFNAGFQNGTYRGFGLGPGKDTTSTYYGRFNGGAGAKVRITYTK